MITCPNCNRDIPDGTKNCPDCGHEIPVPVQQDPQPERQARAIPNIPRRDQDPLPERPERGNNGSNKIFMILLAAAVLLFLIYIFRTK